MKKTLTTTMLSTAVVLVASSAAFAGQVLLPNGGFEADPAPPTPGFTTTISNWNLSLTGAPTPGLANKQLGIFSSYGKFNVAPQGSLFVGLSNLGAGTVTLRSAAPFLVSDRLLAFRYAYITNNAVNSLTKDEFHVVVDFFSDAAGNNSIGSRDFTIATNPTKNDAGLGSDPYGGANNPTATQTFNDANGSAFNFVAVDISQFFNSFARVSFVVDNGGPAAGTNGNGLGVAGVVLDEVILTPEPATIGLFALGALGLGGMAWRRRSAKKPLSA